MAWELGDVRLQLRTHDPVGSWFEDPTEIGIAVNGVLDMRMAFTVVNGSGPVSTGELHLERNVDGAGWEVWLIGKLIEPTRSNPPVEFIGDWYLDVLPFEPYPGATVQLRAHLYWSTPGFSEVSTVTVGPELAEGELDEFFRDDDFAILMEIGGASPRSVWGIYNESFKRALGNRRGLRGGHVLGWEPTVLCERALVDSVAVGAPITFPDDHPGRTWVLRGKRPTVSGTVALRLEETS